MSQYSRSEHSTAQHIRSEHSRMQYAHFRFLEISFHCCCPPKGRLSSLGSWQTQHTQLIPRVCSTQL